MLSNLLPPDLKDAGAFVESLSTLYGDGAVEQILSHMVRDKWATYWPNLLQPGATEMQGEPITDMANMWRVPQGSGFSASEAASQAQVYIQNVSSRFAVDVLAPLPGEEVLDLAAAPGGKTIAMAVAMKNEGRIAAVEPIKGRFHRLRANVQRCGVTIVDFYQRDGRGVGRAVPERFDRVLLDAPCSSQARMRWSDPRTYQHWSLRKVKESSRKQKSLIRSAYAALKPGGQLLYCTCSFSQEENERVVADLLKKTDAQILPIDNVPSNSIAGVVAWRKKSLPEEIVQTVRIVPDGLWHGFYLALIAKP